MLKVCNPRHFLVSIGFCVTTYATYKARVAFEGVCRKLLADGRSVLRARLVSSASNSKYAFWQRTNDDACQITRWIKNKKNIILKLMIKWVNWQWYHDF